MDALSVLDNFYPKLIHNAIANILDMILEYWYIFTPYALSQLEAQIFIKIGTTWRSYDGLSHTVVSAHLGPGPELFNGYTFLRPETPLISS